VARLYDTSVLIDHLRGVAAARELLRSDPGVPHASELTRLEVLAGMRPQEADATQALLGLFAFHAVDREVAELAGVLGRRYLPAFGGIDSVDLGIAATAQRLGLELVTRNVKHFPMFPDLAPPY
jgi:predicted nucleic acid-binding protein